MKKIIRTATVAVISILLAAGISCTDNEQFRVNGTIEGKPTINLRAAYWADGAYRQLLTASRDGEFEFFGSSKTPAVVDIMDHEYRVIGRIYIANGQNVECTLDRSNPFNISASGNETVEKWTRFLKENADSLRSGSGTANAIIGRYVKANPADVVSTLLMLTAFDASADPAGADSLLFSIDVSARPSSLTSGYNFLLERLITAADTINPIVYFDAATGKGATFRPEDSGRSMIVFSTEDSRYIARSRYRSLEKPYTPRFRHLAARMGGRCHGRSRNKRHRYKPTSVRRCMRLCGGNTLPRPVNRIGRKSGRYISDA